MRALRSQAANGHVVKVPPNELFVLLMFRVEYYFQELLVTMNGTNIATVHGGIHHQGRPDGKL